MDNKCPAWAWVVMGILAFITIVLLIMNYNSFSYDEYAQCVDDLGNTTMEYLNLGGDYLDLLSCYQKGLPRCDALIQKGYAASAFTQQGK